MLSYLPKLLTQFAASCDPGQGFFRLTPWYEYLDSTTDAFGKCIPTIDGGKDIWLIGLAVIDSLLKIAAMVAIGMVIYGGVQFTISQGEPDKTNAARNTIINAMVGLVIAMSAAAIVSYIGTNIG